MDIELMDALRRYSACQATDAFDKLKIKGHMPDIVLLSPDPDYRMAGEAHTVQMIPAGGVVLDGRARDIEEHRRMGFPVFAGGVSVHGSGGYTLPSSVGDPINCGGVAVRQGDIILGDVNGVVVIPKERIKEIIAKMDELAEVEEKITSELEKGATIGETFAKYRD